MPKALMTNMVKNVPTTPTPTMSMEAPLTFVVWLYRETEICNGDAYRKSGVASARSEVYGGLIRASGSEAHKEGYESDKNCQKWQSIAFMNDPRRDTS